MKIKARLNTKVVIPMLMFVISAREYEIELIGVVPSVETIENATPSDIIKSPTTNEEILLNILIIYILHLF